MSRDLEEVRRIVHAGLRGISARVYLFGSWAVGRARRTSDIDVAILHGAPLPRGLLSGIREELDNSCVIYSVDLVDPSQASEELRERVLSEGVLWTG